MLSLFPSVHRAWRGKGATSTWSVESKHHGLPSPKPQQCKSHQDVQWSLCDALASPHLGEICSSSWHCAHHLVPCLVPAAGMRHNKVGAFCMCCLCAALQRAPQSQTLTPVSQPFRSGACCWHDTKTLLLQLTVAFGASALPFWCLPPACLPRCLPLPLLPCCGASLQATGTSLKSQAACASSNALAA